MLQKILKEKNMSIYECSKLTGIPYTTLSEMVRGKTRIEKCSAETVFKIAKLFNTTVEKLIEDAVEARLDFEIFKSNVCHIIKDTSDLDFIIEVLKEDEIRKYWNKGWYPESFYILAMVDYVSRINNIPLCNKYNDIRNKSLKNRIYPRDIELIQKLNPNSKIKEECLEKAIPEFLRFNIIESEIENVF